MEENKRDEMNMDIKMIERGLYDDDKLSQTIQRVIIISLVLIGVFVVGVQVGIRQGYSEGFSNGVETGNGELK